MEVQTKVYSGMWIRLPNEIKVRIAELFGIERTTATHVMDGMIIADGFTEDELSKLNVESMQNFLGSKETDIFKLLNELVLKVQSEMTPAPVVPEEKSATHIHVSIDEGGQVKVESKKVGRPKKNA